RDAIRLERRLELALEDNRLYDLRRWKDDNGNPLIEDVMGSNGSFVKYNLETSTDKYEKTNQKENSNEGSAFTAPRDLLFPIPISEVTLSGGSIKQNPGY
ncbi:MAG TPA: RagB/SusD family nutrient uptake outer membrane protein, partial [Prevotella sp.]|nr:RagB/SusD family nutrient uptake outer membrane protein [Prevotella sp.]